MLLNLGIYNFIQVEFVSNFCKINELADVLLGKIEEHINIQPDFLGERIQVIVY
jgi:hypothetical protein